MKCKNCGYENSDDSRFCLKCGSRMIENDSEQQNKKAAGSETSGRKKAAYAGGILLTAAAAVGITAAVMNMRQNEDASAVVDTEPSADFSENADVKTVESSEAEMFPSETTSAENALYDCKVLYGDFIINQIKSGELTENNSGDEMSDFGGAFELYDLDGDGNEELFISDGFVAGGITDIYTIQDGSVVMIDSYEDHGTALIYGGKYILHGALHDQAGGADGSFYVKNGIELEKVFSFYNDEFSDVRESTQSITRIINDIPVSADEYSAETSVYENMGYVSLGRKYVLNYINISEVLGAAVLSETETAYSAP